MRKKTLVRGIVLLLTLSMLSGCGQKQVSSIVPTQSVTITEAPTKEPEVTATPEPTKEAEATATPEPTKGAEATATPELTKEAEATATPEPTKEPEVTATPEPTEAPEATATPEPTKGPEATATPMPTEAPKVTATPKPTEAPKATATPIPTKAPAPIVETIGSADKTLLAKAEKEYESIVKKMRADGLLDADETRIYVSEEQIGAEGYVLRKEAEGYTLLISEDCIWLEGFCEAVNGIDPAPYYKEVLLATLRIVSEEAETIFSEIDMNCFGSNEISNTEWKKVGDCYLQSGESTGDTISYRVVNKASVKDVSKYEKQWKRDATYVLKGTKSDGTPIECVIEYDSSLVVFEYSDWSQSDTFYGTEDDPVLGWPVPVCDSIRIGNDVASYEDYKNMVIQKLNAAGADNAHIEEFSRGSVTVNGYDFHTCEIFYTTETAIGDPDMLYVQIGANEYIEIHDFWCMTTLEEFINTAFYIKEVR